MPLFQRRCTNVSLDDCELGFILTSYVSTKYNARGREEYPPRLMLYMISQYCDAVAIEINSRMYWTGYHTADICSEILMGLSRQYARDGRRTRDTYLGTRISA